MMVHQIGMWSKVPKALDHAPVPRYGKVGQMASKQKVEWCAERLGDHVQVSRGGAHTCEPRTGQFVGILMYIEYIAVSNCILMTFQFSFYPILCLPLSTCFRCTIFGGPGAD